MRILKKIILCSTRFPVIGKYVKRLIDLYRYCLQLGKDLESLKHQLNNLAENLNKKEDSKPEDLALKNLTLSVPVGFRNFQTQLSELTSKINQLEQSTSLQSIKEASTTQ